MDIAEIVQLVISNGFAIVVAVWCLKFTFDTMAKSMTDTNTQLTDLAKAINDNTVVLTKLVEEIEHK